MHLDDIGLFGITFACRWIKVNMSCQSIYPQCNITTQALLPPCEHDCLVYTDYCNNITKIFSLLSNTNDPLDTNFNLNCSTPFRAFGSVANVDADKCYNFSCKLIYIQLLICGCLSRS